MSRKTNVCHRAVQAPSWGYPTETAYYRDAQSADAVVAIRIPFLAINAEDDPVCFPFDSVTQYGPADPTPDIQHGSNTL
jgi:predicted alpha/beta-fold hydrolase